jgi:hypothetical protein
MQLRGDAANQHSLIRPRHRGEEQRRTKLELGTASIR